MKITVKQNEQTVKDIFTIGYDDKYMCYYEYNGIGYNVYFNDEDECVGMLYADNEMTARNFAPRCAQLQEELSHSTNSQKTLEMAINYLSSHLAITSYLQHSASMYEKGTADRKKREDTLEEFARDHYNQYDTFRNKIGKLVDLSDADPYKANIKKALMDERPSVTLKLETFSRYMIGKEYDSLKEYFERLHSPEDTTDDGAPF